MLVTMNELQKNNVVSFPSKLLSGEERILYYYWKALEILNEAASGNYVLGESDQEGLNYLNSLFVKWNLHPLNISFSKEEPNEVVKLKADSISDARYWAVKILSKVSLGIYELTEKNKQDLRSLNEILIKWNYEPLEIDF